MLEIEKVTYSDEELEDKIEQNLKQSPAQHELVESACYPMTDGCCIKKGAT